MRMQPLNYSNRRIDIDWIFQVTNAHIMGHVA